MNLNVTFKKLFLIDAIGALVSAIMLGWILIHFQQHIGMPIFILKILAGIASLFCIHSFSCFYINPLNPEHRMRIIAIANLLYCISTFILVLFYFEELKLFGLLYFIVEILIVTLLARIELKSTF